MPGVRQGQGNDPYGDYDAASAAHTGGTSPYELSNLPPGSWQEPAPGTPADAPPSVPGGGPPSGPPGWTPPGSSPGPGGSGSTPAAVVALSVFALLVIAAGALLTSLHLGSGGANEPAAEATETPTEPEARAPEPEDDEPTSDPNWPAPEEAAIVWEASVDGLRDLRGVGFVPNLGGADSSPLGEADDVWFAVSADGLGDEAMLHGFDAGNGEEVWRRDLDLALCAHEAAPGGEIICASAVDRPPGGFATQWRLHLLDPETGEDVRTQDVDLHVRAIRLNAAGIVVLEDREPGPDAWLHLYDFDLDEVWSLDLTEVSDYEQLFTSYAYSTRRGPWTEEDLRGEALDLGALGEVGPEGESLVVQAYAHALLVDAATGELVSEFMSCFDLIDDGQYLWCGGALDRLNVYDYSGELVLDVLAETGRQSGLMGLHPREGERVLSGRPITHNWDGELIPIDPEDGSAGAPYGETGYDLLSEESDFRIYGDSVYSGGHRLVLEADLGRMLMLDPEREEVRWEFTAPRISGVVVHDDVVYVENAHSGQVLRLGLDDGNVLGTWQIQPTRQLRIHDGELVDFGLSGLTRYDIG